jgi:uncharacterized protein (DUF2249 family)
MSTPTPAGQSGPLTLPGEHALLIGQVTARTDDLLAVAAENRWPERELQQLLNYLHLEVLRQIVDEEWLLFRDSHQDPSKLAPLLQEHVEIRQVIDLLADAAASPAQSSPAELAATTRDLIDKLLAHVKAEEQVFDVEQDAPSTSAMGSAPHTWYELTDGPLIDLDRLPGAQGADAALGRMLRLRGGEQVELQTSCDPYPLRRRLAMADPDGYGFSYLEQGPPKWRVQVSRRLAGPAR